MISVHICELAIVFPLFKQEAEQLTLAIFGQQNNVSLFTDISCDILPSHHTEFKHPPSLLFIPSPDHLLLHLSRHFHYKSPL